MNRSLESVADELHALESRSLRRSLATVRPLGGARGESAGRPVLIACSNDYLGLARDPRLAEAAAEAGRTDGAGAGAARLVSGSRPAHERLESAVRAFAGTESALTFASGYAANLAVLGALLGPEDLVVSDARNHASLVDGLRLCGAERRVLPHADVGAFRDALADRARFRRAAVVTEGLFSMDGDVAPLAALTSLADARGALLFVDDAHGTGVLGPTGRGALEVHGVGALPWVVRVGTFGKAFGAAGAFVASASDVIALTVSRGRAFVYTTAPAPPTVAAAAEGLAIAQSEPERRARCLGLAARLRHELARRGVSVAAGEGPIVPVPLGDEVRALAASRALLAEYGVLATAIRPPTVPAGTSRFRLTTSASQTDDEVDRIAAAVAEVLR